MLPSSSIVTNGLVFYYDVNNQKSYAGPPLRNFLGALVPIPQTNTGKVVTGGSEIVNIPTLGELTTQFVNFQNTGAADCCVSFMNFGNAGNIFTGSTLYTYLILYRSDSGYTNSNWMYRYEYNSSGTYQTEGGVHSTGNRTYLGNGWYYAWGTFTTQAATTQLHCYAFSYNYSSFNDKISFAKACIVQGNYSGLHPKYWPELNTTRSNTQTLIDVTNTNTITAQSLSYASDGTISFSPGSSNYISWGSNSMSNFTSGVTLEAWVNINTSGTNWTRIFDFGAGQNIDNLLLCQYSSTNELAFYIIVGSTQYNLLTSTSAITNNQNTHFAATANGSNWFIYKNGVQIATTASSVLPANVTRNSNYIGRSNWADPYINGKVYSAKIYNRALSPSEVAENFNAQRALYGV